jgi:altronate hydrolase
MDLNCGGIADGECSIDEMGEQIFNSILRVASGDRTKSELHGYGQSEFVPWQLSAIT